jgi:hypothetical protein
MAKKTKNYEISITAFATVLVTGVKNEAEAMELVSDAMDFGKFVMDEIEVKREIVTEAELINSRRHADTELKYS